MEDERGRASFATHHHRPVPIQFVLGELKAKWPSDIFTTGRNFRTIARRRR
jgi:hypothetical protein